MTQDMNKKRKNKIITFDDVRDRIVEVRGKKAILDFAVAELLPSVAYICWPQS